MLLLAATTVDRTYAEPARVFTTEIACERQSGLGAATCRRAFQVAQAIFTGATRSYPNRFSCYRAFGPCMPWPAGPTSRFRPQLMGFSVTGAADAIAAAPVLAPGHLRLSLSPRLISAALPEAIAADAQPAAASAPPSEEMVALCRHIAAVAAKEHLPPAFLARLLWQESSFRARVVSRAGAQGIAQFMPGTALDRGLADPLDPVEAIRSSAALLGDLARQFGNLGLAAAAYNGGPARVSGWLHGRRLLAPETENYVLRITGRTARAWATGEQGLDLAPPAACLDLAAPRLGPTGNNAAGAQAARAGGPAGQTE